MDQPLHAAHPVSDNSPTAGQTPYVLVWSATGLGGLAVIATLALWFHYGTRVFFEMIRAGFSACF
jgi:hypothetical protein